MSQLIYENGIPILTDRSNTSGNSTQIEPDGTIKLLGNATVWDDLRVPLFSRGGGTAPSYSSGFAGNSGLYYWSFAGNSTNNMYFEMQMPHSWAGTTIYPHVHWSPTTTNTGTVRWLMEYTWCNVNSTFGASSVFTMDSVVSVSSQWNNIIAPSGDGITPSASQNAISSIMIGRIYRAGGGTGDTYANAAALLSIDFHFEIDTMGSRDTTTK
jgi:hypothetical protein